MVLKTSFKRVSSKEERPARKDAGVQGKRRKKKSIKNKQDDSQS